MKPLGWKGNNVIWTPPPPGSPPLKEEAAGRAKEKVKTLAELAAGLGNFDPNDFCNACNPPKHCAACLEDIAWLEAPLTDEEQAAIEAADDVERDSPNFAPKQVGELAARGFKRVNR